MACWGCLFLLGDSEDGIIGKLQSFSLGFGRILKFEG